MKKGIYAVIYVIVTFIVLRLVVPTLMSAQDTFAVIIGFVTVCAWSLSTALIAKKLMTKKESK